MVIKNINKMMFISLLENEFESDGTKVRWYYAKFIVDEELIRLKVNSKLLENFKNLPQYSFVDVEYLAIYDLKSEDGTKYICTFEYVQMLPFDDKLKLKKGEQ